FLPRCSLFLKLVAQHPCKVLSISLVIQVVLYYADYRWLQQGTVASSGFLQIVAGFQDRFVLVYQFYFVLGGFTALYFQQIRSFLLRYGWISACVMVAGLAVLLLLLVFQLRDV